MAIARMYEVEKLKGKVDRTFVAVKFKDVVAGFDDEGNEITKKVPERHEFTKSVDAGFMVYTPKRDSFHVWDEQGLIEKGIDPSGRAGLVDTQTGEVIEERGLSLKQQVQHRALRY